MEIISRCASLRRLRLPSVKSAVLFSVLAAPARAQLESLSLVNVSADSGPPPPVGAVAAAEDIAVSAADVQSWKDCFEHLQSLRALSLRFFGCFDVVLAGAAAALATGTALRNLTALRADTLQMDNEGGSLIPLLAAHCPQLSRLHVYEIYSDSSYSPGALDGLSLLRSLTDLRLQCDTQPSNDDELAVGRCASLTRLHLSDIRSSCLHSILRSPQLQRLESLTLESVHFDRDCEEEEEEEEEGGGGGEGRQGRCSCGQRSRLVPLLRQSAIAARVRPGSRLWRRPAAGRTAGRVPAAALVALQPRQRLLEDGSGARAEAAGSATGPALEAVQGAASWSDYVGEYAETVGAWLDAWNRLKREHPDRVTITQLTRGDRDPFGIWRD